jgi:hypothetical protein
MTQGLTAYKFSKSVWVNARENVEINKKICGLELLVLLVQAKRTGNKVPKVLKVWSA